MNNLLDYTLAELKVWMKENGESAFRGEQIISWIYKGTYDFDTMKNMSKASICKLKENFIIALPKIIEVYKSDIDGTEKFLLGFEDGNLIESVLMRYKHGNSICISTQIGCKMGCKFCASTIEGCVRNLSCGEILAQVLVVQKYIDERISNIVLMGSGEPLDNYDNVVKFLEVISAEYGLNIGQRHITLSTCGIVPKIYELADKEFSITLAISLHSFNDEKRKEIMPIANKYSIYETLEACRYYINKTNRRITFEYALVKDVNDGSEDAKALGKLLKGMLCHVNLIPVNEIKENAYKRSSKKSIDDFSEILKNHGIEVTTRREMGSDINAACGQLRRSYMETQKNKGENEMVGLVSDVGLKRTLNEDFASYLEKEEFKIYVVADGMGGHNAGEVASKMAAEQIVSYVNEKFSLSKTEDLIMEAIKKANRDIFDFSNTNENLSGMGTTVTACFITENFIRIANVGDSCCLAIRNNSIEKITKDHSLVQELVDSGSISEKEAQHHSKKNIITRALGTSGSVSVDVFQLENNQYDLYILCSDGLTNELTKEEILKVVIEEDNYIDMANKLVYLAKEKGGRDNITVLLFRGEM